MFLTEAEREAERALLRKRKVSECMTKRKLRDIPLNWGIVIMWLVYVLVCKITGKQW